jgi:AcrR family transcriptional regulator
MTIGQISETRRSRGRPQLRSDDQTRSLIIEAAAKEFERLGYAATCMADVGQRAGVSTKTMYRLIPTKGDLFKAVVQKRIQRFVLALDAGALEDLSLAEGVERLMIAYGELTLEPETIAMSRLVIGESDRFPELAASFYELAIVRTTKAMADWLKRHVRDGAVRIDNLEETVGMLRGMMIMEPQRAAMLKQRPLLTRDEIAARAKVCAKLFLDGVIERDADASRQAAALD